MNSHGDLEPGDQLLHQGISGVCGIYKVVRTSVSNTIIYVGGVFKCPIPDDQIDATIEALQKVQKELRKG